MACGHLIVVGLLIEAHQEWALGMVHFIGFNAFQLHDSAENHQPVAKQNWNNMNRT